MGNKTTYKIIELVQFKQPLGIFTVRKIEKIGRIVISSKVFESKDKKECEKIYQW